MGISSVLIVLNEEERIARALDDLQWTDEQIVVDGGSNDHTREICLQRGAKVFERPFDNFENQKNYALSKANHDWVLSVDADEIVTPPLAKEIQEAVKNRGNYNGFWIRRENYFLGKPLRFGGQGKEFILRLFLKDQGRFSGIVHEQIVVDEPTGHLKNELKHTSTETLTEYYTKLKLYTNLDAERLVREKRVPSLLKAIFFPPIRWFLNYILKFGFLDGWSGLLFHGLSCYYGWLKNFKARSINSNIRVCHADRN